jgi:hypothetical protein
VTDQTTLEFLKPRLFAPLGKGEAIDSQSGGPSGDSGKVMGRKAISAPESNGWMCPATWLLALGPDALHSKRLASHQRQRQGSAQDLSTPFSF